jgi:hypothetical protein
MVSPIYMLSIKSLGMSCCVWQVSGFNRFYQEMFAITKPANEAISTQLSGWYK